MMDHLPASTSPLRSKFKNEPSKSVTKQSKSMDDNPTAQSKIPKKSQLPTMQSRASLQARAPEHIRAESAASQGPKRSRSTPSSSLATYAHIISSKQAFQQSTSKSSDTSPNLLHRQSAIPVPVTHNVAGITSVAKKPPGVHVLHPSVSVPGTAQQLDSQRQRLVDRAIKARLYLLRQSGPNRFLIGGDSPDSRFHVTIGPQSCSCNRTHCVHLLFVMLRVLKVNRNDPMLWMRQLRNYEAESLLQGFQTRLSNRSTLKRFSKKLAHRNSRIEEKPAAEREDEQKLPQTQSLPPSMIGGHMKVSVTKSDGGEGSGAGDSVMATVMEEGEGEGEGEGGEAGEGESDKSDNEEAICPICLNELDEGEDLLVCSSCHNHLHQHCMDIWAGEQRRKKEDVRCPVCRAHWPYTVSLGPSSSSSPPTLTAIHISVPIGSSGAMGSSSDGASGAGGGIQLSAATAGMTAGEGGGGVGKGGSAPSHFVLSGQKMQLLERMKMIFGSSVEGLFSSDWKARETAVLHISRESVSLLLPYIHSSLSKVPPMNEGAAGSGGNSGDPHEVQEVCMQVVTIAANDSVLKVFLAALELLRVVLGYSMCKTEEEASFLQSLLGPILPVLLTRCADAQRRVKNCSIETACNLCLGQEGPLGVGNACGSHTSSKLVSDVRFVLQSALANQFDANHSWHWWLGRLAFIDRMLSHFSWDFLLPQCQLNPQSQQQVVGASDDDSDDKGSSNSDSVSGPASPIDSVASSIVSSLMAEGGSGSDSQPQSFEFELQSGMEPELAEVGTELRQSGKEKEKSPSPMPAAVENNLLMQVWYFAAKATHVPHRKLGKVAQRVIIKIAKGLQDDPASLEIVHDVVSKCHRTQAEGLLDRVLHAREKPLDSLKASGRTFSAATLRPRRREEEDDEEGLSPRSREKGRRRASSSSPDHQHAARQREMAALKVAAKKNRVSADLTQLNVEGSLKLLGASKKKTSSTLPEARHLRKTDTESTIHAGSPEFEASDESFQSAISDLDHREHVEDREGEEGSEGTSSASNSHDSKKGMDAYSRSSSGYASGVASGGASAAGGVERRPGAGGLLTSRLYKRQSTADSAVSTGDEDYSSFGYMCKKNIEEEEAAAEAKVRSMIPQDMPHPSLSGMPLPSFNHKVLIHIQRSKLDGNTKEGTDGSSHPPYLEGEHWIKGKLIGTGAFCSCFLARDIKNGTMFAVKQVSYVRNTQKEQDEELNRLTQEVTMLGRLNHPNVVRCLGATQHDGHINVFVEWMAGGCLDQLLHDFGRFSENVASDYTRQITYGIVYLHENGIIHRDLKGGNVLVDSTGRRLRIADFGAAARLATNTTGAGEFQEMEGTVAFMAPEVVRGGQVDETGANIGYGRKCDVWSIGCVVIQMLTAKPPWAGTFDRKNKFQLIFKIGQATEPPPIPEFANPSLKDFTIRCLEIRPEDRPTSSELLKHPLFTASA